MSTVHCPFCQREMKEITSQHLARHEITVAEYDLRYPLHPRMSPEQRKKKQRYQNMTPELSAKLSKSHTLEGYIERHGKETGTKRYQQTTDRNRKSKTLERFVEKFGHEEGARRYNEFKITSKTKMSLQNFIKKYGIVEGTQRWEQFQSRQKRKGTEQYYQEKYGIEDGTKRFKDRIKKQSLSIRKIPIEETRDYDLYKQRVYRFTRQSLKKSSHTLANFNLRGKGKQKYHVDHKYSICEGFKHNIPPYIIGDIVNLEMITGTKNSRKQNSCSISLEQLFESCFMLLCPCDYVFVPSFLHEENEICNAGFAPNDPHRKMRQTLLA